MDDILGLRVAGANFKKWSFLVKELRKGSLKAFLNKKGAEEKGVKRWEGRISTGFREPIHFLSSQ